MFNEFWGSYPSELSEKAIKEAREEREDDKARMAKENFFGGYEEFMKVNDWLVSDVRWIVPTNDVSNNAPIRMLENNSKSDHLHQLVSEQKTFSENGNYFIKRSYDFLLEKLSPLPKQERFAALKKNVSRWNKEVEELVREELGYEYRTGVYRPLSLRVPELIQYCEESRDTFLEKYHMKIKGAEDLAFFIFKYANGMIRGQSMPNDLKDLVEGKKVYEIRELIKPYL